MDSLRLSKASIFARSTSPISSRLRPLALFGGWAEYVNARDSDERGNSPVLPVLHALDSMLRLDAKLVSDSGGATKLVNQLGVGVQLGLTFDVHSAIKRYV